MKKLLYMSNLKLIGKIFISVIAVLAISGASLYAQDKSMRVTGTVYDENKQPMPGVGVLVVGSLNGVISDVDGKYSISVNKGQELQFSFLGYKTEAVVVGNSNIINVIMQTDAQVMETAVVTALGIKRDEKSIGYSETHSINCLASVISSKEQPSSASFPVTFDRRSSIQA